MLNVRAGEACPRRLLTVTTSIPAEINAEAWLCRREWNVIWGSPRLFTARRQLFVILLGFGRLPSILPKTGVSPKVGALR